MTTPAIGKLGARARDRLLSSEIAPLQRWRYRWRGWLRSLPQRLLRKTSLSALIEDQVRARTEELFRQANFDALTHLPNRNYFSDTLERTIKQAEQDEVVFALLFLDLDGFKPVNDTYGHAAGDELLRLVAGRLTASVREDDFVARLGGDEFVILLRDLVDDEIIQTISKRLIREVSRPYWVNGRAVEVSTSVGVAEFPADGKTASQLMEHADQALYVAKHRGRKQYVFYKEVENMVSAAPDKIQTRFEVDAEHARFSLHFRPVIDLKTSHCVGARMNVLWDGAPDPAMAWYEDWKPLLKKSQWANSMGLWIIESAAWHFSCWQHVPEPFRLVVPLDMSLMLQDNLVRVLLERIAKYWVSPDRFLLEVDLSTLYRLDAKAVRTIRSLMDAGFGIVYSGFGKEPIEPDQLYQLPMDHMALDARWASSKDPAQAARWMRGMIRLGCSLEAKVMINHVQDVLTAQRYSRDGAQYGDGEAWQDYLPADNFGRYLAIKWVA